MNTKILLKENEVIANSVIEQKQKQFQNGKMLLSLLANLGIERTELSSWQDIENEMKQSFPNATAEFNAASQGIEQQYTAAKDFYQLNAGNLSFQMLTAEEIEAIKEQYRVYATEKQAEAYKLAHSVVDGLNRLKDLGLPIDPFYVSKLSTNFVESNGKIEIYNRNFIDAIAGLK